MTHEAVARRYYEAIDAGEYERLRSLLADGFVQRRPDRTFEGADSFVRFMREDRPQPETTHELEVVYTSADGVAAEGRLVERVGGQMFRFVDTFAFDGDRISSVRTYTQPAD